MISLTRRLSLISVLLAAPAFAQTPVPAKSEAEAAVDETKIRLQNGETDDAIKAGEKAVKLAPQSADAYHLLGRVYGQKAQEASIFSQISWAKKCRDAWEKAVALDPKDTSIRLDLIRFHIMAPGIAGGDKDKARQQVVEIAKLDAARGFVANGLIADLEKDTARAEKEYRKAYETDAKKGYRALVSSLSNQKRWDEAAAIARDVVALDPADPGPRLVQARVALYSGKDLEKGLEAAEQFLALPHNADTPSPVNGHWTKGLLYEKLGKKDLAVAALTQAQKLQPQNKKLRKDLERLKG